MKKKNTTKGSGATWLISIVYHSIGLLSFPSLSSSDEMAF